MLVVVDDCYFAMEDKPISVVGWHLPEIRNYYALLCCCNNRSEPIDLIHRFSMRKILQIVFSRHHGGIVEYSSFSFFEISTSIAGRQVQFAQSYALRRDFYEFVFRNKFYELIQR